MNQTHPLALGTTALFSELSRLGREIQTFTEQLLRKLEQEFAPKIPQLEVEFAGVNRFVAGNAGNFGITGAHAHAAVRMHAYPVTGSSWDTCPKTKTSYFQRWKVASLR